MDTARPTFHHQFSVSTIAAPDEAWPFDHTGLTVPATAHRGRTGDHKDEVRMRAREPVRDTRQRTLYAVDRRLDGPLD